MRPALLGAACACWLLIAAVVWAGVLPTQPQPVTFVPANAREQFALDLLAALGNDAPTGDIVAFVVEWTLAEDTSDNALARNNPLNTTMCGYNMIGAINADGACGVQTYATYQDGLAATVQTLANGRYDALVAALQTNDADAALSALIASPWAASHYGGGVAWPRYQMQAGNDARQQVIALALAQVGKPYSLGAAGPATFDCSGLVQWSYAQIGIATTRTTFSQLAALPVVAPDQLQPGDLIYFQYPADQHTGILADLDGDGRWDMVQSGGTRRDVNVVYDVFADPTYADAIIGYRRAL